MQQEKCSSEKKDFAARLRELRGDVSQAAFARKIGVSQQNLNRYEAGLVIPRGHILRIIATQCGVSIDWLLGNKGLDRLDLDGTVHEAPGMKSIVIGHPARKIISVPAPVVREESASYGMTDTERLLLDLARENAGFKARLTALDERLKKLEGHGDANTKPG